MERDFKGVWIPKAIWLDNRLNALDKVILTEIDSLDNGEAGCYASNKYIAEFCQCSERKVSDAITKLTKLGYIKLTSFDGRTRILQSCIEKSASLPRKNCEAETQNLRGSTIENNTMNNKENTQDEIQSVVDLYNQICVSLPRARNITDKRKSAIKARLKKYSVEQIREAFEKAEQSDFLTGKVKEFTASFDWILNETNLVKIIEGNYGNKTVKPKPKEDDMYAGLDDDKIF
jgi:DNA-binding Lrp family transcriptional regulator